MQQATVAVRPMIHFRGLDFSHETIDCPNCSWEGEAGSLLAPIAKAAGDAVAYSCPKCHEAIATHAGFSSEEIRKEISAIRNLISEVKVLRSAIG